MIIQGVILAGALLAPFYPGVLENSEFATAAQTGTKVRNQAPLRSDDAVARLWPAHGDRVFSSFISTIDANSGTYQGRLLSRAYE